MKKEPTYIKAYTTRDKKHNILELVPEPKKTITVVLPLLPQPVPATK